MTNSNLESHFQGSQAFLGHANDESTRYRASSGGIGSALLNFLFETNVIQTAINFQYSTADLRYFPELIYSRSDYHSPGSIYHEIDLIKFVKDSIESIRGCILIFALPCQVRPIKVLLKNRGIECIVISLTCSAQQSLDATFYLLKRLGVERSKVERIQYRGNGWPSGVQITMNDQSRIFCDNNSSVWKDIFHSRLFTMKRCFFCQDTISIQSDLTLADPWLDEFSKETVGKTLVVVSSPRGASIIDAARHEKSITAIEFPMAKVIQSQKWTFEKKDMLARRKSWTKFLMSLVHWAPYRFVVLGFPICFNLHIRLLRLSERIFR